MAVVITLPPEPRPIPPLDADPGRVREFAAALLAASAQVDDLGEFVAAQARVPSWTGAAATAYHDAIRPTGRTADAMSLALRAVARRTDQHADALQALLDRRAGLVAERVDLLDAVADLRGRVDGAPAEQAAELEAACHDCARRVRAFGADVDRWATDLIAEEEAMREAFARVLTLEQVERRYGDAPDPADEALDSMPGPGASQAAVNAWWDGLTDEKQLAVIAASPGSIGNRDGIPPWARAAANTVALDRDLAEWEHLDELGVLTDEERTWWANARATDTALVKVRATVDPVTNDPVPAQLYLYDPTAFGGDGAVAIAAGDLGAADNVAVTVPGFGTDAGSAPFQAERVRALYESTRFLAPEESTATMLWIGYDAPDNPPWEGDGDWSEVLSEGHATAGGERLADLLGGLRASRNGEPAHLTAIGHSYGSTTLGHAAHDHGVPVDDLVVVGSPGLGGDTDGAAGTGVDPDHVWAGANSRDPIADLSNHGWVHLETLGGGGLGDDPAEDDFGAIRFQAESTTRAPDAFGIDAFADHSKYFDHGSESLYNISQVVVGDYADVVRADPVHDPWYAGPQDPEFDRDPTSPTTKAPE